MNFFKFLPKLLQENATNVVSFELEELENLFALMLFGNFVGIPLTPVSLSLELLPYLGKEIEVMNKRTFELDDMLCRIGV
ncbi:MAG: hypothetical protein EF806_03640 [Candidatus Methanoliparum thermophilum]|uniref:Uncharacterized protein n=1 Tax=Methanoliparum thermophilum TaxID=2491083 RepID=A0A520KRS2_METT2|nr:hypothetical protein [Candidatus Methanoliparum sp. LAM-1]RZN64447.1 MAG: hypothetical protein EF806_03640 [Candidatus Methanoliparum thermophilum]BDC35964.1 hypothetical protein MTLP_06460 [Candidatus Methanoliparum sp. LAM-1]